MPSSEDTDRLEKGPLLGVPNFASGTIWTGDNLNIMRGINDSCIDLIYLDPPFNSNRHYEAPIGSKAAGAAFKDAWTLDDVDVHEHGELADRNPAVCSVIEAARLAHGKSMQSYLIMMAVRLLEMRRILKPTGSIYLHCDPTASHYLKLLMDGVFGCENFRNEVVWCYTGRLMKGKRGFNSKHDIILFYAKTGHHAINPVTEAIDRDEYVKMKKQKVHVDEKGKEWIWGHAGKGKSHEYRIYIDEAVKKGKALSAEWKTPIINTSSKERTGYPTQKPLALLERIIEASTHSGDMVLDPFCGCATSLVAADRAGRNWAGIDLSPLSIRLVNDRVTQDRGPLFKGATALNDPPKRTDQGNLPGYRTNKHRLYGEQEGRCNGCDMHFPYKVFEIDHILPRSKGGSGHPDNLQLLCNACNRSKGDKTMAEWKATRGW